jgi:hypothetical protein
VFDRFTRGRSATVLGAVLLIAGGVIVVAHGGFAGTAIAVVGCLMVVRERMRQRKTPPPE